MYVSRAVSQVLNGKVMITSSGRSDSISMAHPFFLVQFTPCFTLEAEWRRLSGTEDDLKIKDYEAKLTDVDQAKEFIDMTGIDALAVGIGNVRGKYPASGPKLRLYLLKECIKRGARKFNVNTEVRKAYMDSLTDPEKDLINVVAAT